MNKDLNKGIKRLLILDTLLGSMKSVSNAFNEADKEIEDFFKSTNKYTEKLRNSTNKEE